MAFPLGTVLSAAPGLISAAADIIRAIKQKKQAPPQPPPPDTQKIDELASLVEKQAVIIEELALNNRNLVLAVRNNRILSVLSLAIGLAAWMFVLWNGR